MSQWIKFLKMLSEGAAPGCTQGLSMQFYAELAEHSMVHLDPLVISQKTQTNLAICCNNRYNFLQSFNR
jgi:hypothetical protein